MENERKFEIGTRFPIRETNEYGEFEERDERPLAFIVSKNSQEWESDTRWDGNNTVFIHGGQCAEQTLYWTGKRWVIVHSAGGPNGTTWESGFDAYAEIITDREAANWLIQNGDELPERLEQLDGLYA